MEGIYPLHSVRNFYLSRVLSDNWRLIRNEVVSLIFISPLGIFHFSGIYQVTED